MLTLLDTCQGDVQRHTKRFLVVKASWLDLRLLSHFPSGLSDAVSHKTSIDPLFPDKGFGTSDAETLDIVMDALDNLNAAGKMIGVISHIEALRQRISAQLRVIKKSWLGE